MIIDCHTHMDFDTQGATPPEKSVLAGKVDLCIVLADTGDSSEQANDRLCEYIGHRRDRTVGFALVNPLSDDVTEKNLSALREKQGLKGLVLYCCENGFHPCDSRAMQLYDCAQQLSMPVFFHNGRDLGCDAVLNYAQPFLLDEVARTYPELKIVIGNMGEPFIAQTFSMLGKHKNVYADLTVVPDNPWQVYNTVTGACEYGVMDKLLFGSGFPAGNAGECMEVLLGFNRLFGDTTLPTVPRGNIKNVIERNTLELLGIDS